VTGYIRRRLFASSSMLLYKGVAGEGCEPPNGTSVIAIPPRDISSHMDDLRAVGAESDIGNAVRGAACYIAYINATPVAAGWLFSKSRLLKRLHYPEGSTYLGGFVTHPDHRGIGLYPLLLRVMGQSVEAGAVCVVETSSTNVPSQRGLVKAGFQLVGTVRRVVVAGIMVKCELERGFEQEIADLLRREGYEGQEGAEGG